jgi:hypothetical protein
MSRSQLVFPVLVRSAIAPAQHRSQLLVRPGVQIDRFHARDVDAHGPVDARAADAHEDADVPGCPSWVLVALAVSACLVGFELDQLLERG